MNSSDLHKLVSSHFEGDAPGRIAWAVIETGHSWIELCKLPFLRFGEAVADIGKYVIGLGLPALGVVLLEWACSGSFL